MTISPTTQAPLLSWAIGAPIRIEQNGPIPVAELLALFKDHRVTGRALDRVGKEAPGWASQELVEGLRHQQQENEQMVAEQAAALAQLRKQYIPAKQPIIIFKGVGAYAHSGNYRALRRALDLDIVLLDPDPVVEKMKKEHLEEYRNVSPHELINVRVQGVEIDLHGYYPIWSTDRKTSSAALNAHDGITLREHSGTLVVSELSAELLLKDALATDLFGVPDVFFPDPAAGALIICAHGFRDYLSKSSVTARNKPPLRFAEIAEVAEYVRMPTFNRERFLALMEHTHARDAVEWMAHIVARHAQDPYLLELLSNGAAGLSNEEKAPYAGTPQAVWTGFWEILSRDVGDEVCRHMSTGELVERLGPCLVPASAESGRIELDDACQAAGVARPSTIHIRRSGHLPMTVDLRHRGGELTIQAKVACRDARAGYRLHLDLDGQSFEWQCTADKQFWKKSIAFPTPAVEFLRQNGCYELQLRMPAPVTDRRHYGECVPLVLAAGEFGQGFEIRRGTLLPIIFQLSSTQPSRAN